MIHLFFIKKNTIFLHRSLPTHLPDLQCDPTLEKSDVLCLQETFCHRSAQTPKLDGYTCYLCGEGRGRGVAAFVKNCLVTSKKLLRVERIDEDYVQGLKLFFVDLHILNLYRPPNTESNQNFNKFVKAVQSKISPNQPMMICGDMNFDYWKEPSNRFSVMLKGMGFQQIVKHPTTIHGKCLDHVYLRTKFLSKHKLYYPHYTDHECVCVMLKKPLTS